MWEERSVEKEGEAGRVERGMRDSLWMLARRARWEEEEMKVLKAVRREGDAVEGGFGQVRRYVGGWTSTYR